MRLYELGLVWLLLVAAILVIVGGGKRLGIIALLLSACLAMHVWKEGTRLQAVPLYAAAGIVILCAFLDLGSIPGENIFRREMLATTCTVLLVLLLTGTGAYGCFVFPVFRLPAPTGPYRIGTSVWHFIDESRTDTYGDRAGKKRAIVAQVWYPASSCSGKILPYRDPETLTWKSAHLKHVQTHACADSPFSNEVSTAPVLLFSPSSGGYRTQNTFMAEQFASLGYIFIALDHTNTSSRILWTDGSLLHSLPDVWLNLNSFADLQASTIKTEAILDDNVKDLQYVLDQISISTGEHPKVAAIGAKADLNRVAAVGHSFGGAAAAELCRRDSRVRTGLNMDGWMFSQVNEHGVGKPFLFLVEDDPNFDMVTRGMVTRNVWHENETDIGKMGNQQFYTALRMSLRANGGCVGRVVGSTHGSFSDLGRYTRRVGESMRPVELMQSSIMALLSAFLEFQLNKNDRPLRALLGTPNPLMDVRCSN